jgi:hypothetical protein
VYLLGYYAAGDGGHGAVRKTSSGAMVNGVTVFACADGGATRWERVEKRHLAVEAAGITVAQSAITNANRLQRLAVTLRHRSSMADGDGCQEDPRRKIAGTVKRARSTEQGAAWTNITASRCRLRISPM